MHTKKIGYSVLRLFVAICFCLSIVTPAYAQQTALNIKIKSIDDSAFPKVQAVLSVSDAQGFPIKNLQPGSFKITEQGKPVTAFTVTGFQNTAEPLAVVLVMDTSGSMIGKPLENSISAAKNFTSALAAQDQVGLVSFATTVTTQQTLTADRSLLNSKLDLLTAKGDTDIYDALIEAVGMLKNRSERKVVVLLTDGKETVASKYSFDQVIDESVRWSVPVYPIGFGAVDQATLTKLAQLTGGVAQVNPDSSTLKGAFDSVLSMLREQYRVEFTSSLPADGMEHPLQVSVDYQNGFATDSRNFTARPGQVTVTITGPQGSQPVGGKVTIAGTAQGPAELANVEIRVDGQPLGTAQNSPFSYVWDSTSVQPGAHTLEVTAIDKSGNQGKAEMKLDVVAPITLKLNLTHRQDMKGAEKLSAQVTSVSPGAEVEFFLDGQSIGKASGEPYEISWDASKTNPGIHTISAKATGESGYTAQESVEVNIVLQNSTNILALVLILALAAVAIILPLSLRRRRRITAPAGPVGETLADNYAQPAPSMFPVGAAAGETAEDMTATPGPGLGGGQYVLVEDSGINPGQVWTLSAAETRIGRKRDDNDIPLKGLSASRRHAVIRRQAQNYIIYNLNPQNPLMINNSPVTDQATLCPGDVIEAGESVFRFEANR